jgi:hypothetical protein
LFANVARSTAVLGAVVTGAFFDPPLPLLYYELTLCFRLPNNGLTTLACVSWLSAASAYSDYSLTLLKKSKLSIWIGPSSSSGLGASDDGCSGYSFLSSIPT